jgi:hypothetical protein
MCPLGLSLLRQNGSSLIYKVRTSPKLCHHTYHQQQPLNQVLVHSLYSIGD